MANTALGRVFRGTVSGFLVLALRNDVMAIHAIMVVFVETTGSDTYGHI